MTVRTVRIQETNTDDNRPHGAVQHRRDIRVTHHRERESARERERERERETHTHTHTHRRSGRMASARFFWIASALQISNWTLINDIKYLIFHNFIAFRSTRTRARATVVAILTCTFIFTNPQAPSTSASPWL